jgi:tetratricopeptide (TPR) repeat protein
MRHFVPILLLSFAAATGTGRASGGDPGEPMQTGETPAVLSLPQGSAVYELTEAYRSLYLAFADVDRQRAIDETVAFETRTLAAEPKKGFDRLSSADSRLFEKISEKHPGALLALGVFYQDLAHRHAADRNWGLLLRANKATEELLARLARAAATDSDRATASAGYQAFASDLLDIHAPGRAVEMLERALELTPNDVAANLALAILLQRDERYAPAAARLDRALAADPANREAQLRRALLRVRVDPGGRVLKDLENLAASPDGDWITIVATQERGRLLLAAGKLERAIGWFSAAAERFPAEHSFRTALAFAQARLGRRNAAAIAARALLAAPRVKSESARRRFAESPVRLIEARRGEMRAAAETRWDSLKLALAYVPDANANAAGALH